MKPFRGSGKMICPLCSSCTIVTTAWPGHCSPLHYLPNVITKYRCELEPSFKTLSTFDGQHYQDHERLYVKPTEPIKICWV